VVRPVYPGGVRKRSSVLKNQQRRWFRFFLVQPAVRFLKLLSCPHQANFLAPLPGKKKNSARGVSHAHPLLCFSFALLYFYLHHFIKNKKN
jgi:hypothetical protein